MASSKSRSAAAKKAWATRRKLYGASGRRNAKKTVSSRKSSRMTKALKATVSNIKRKMPITGTNKQLMSKLKKAGLTHKQAQQEVKRFNSF